VEAGQGSKKRSELELEIARAQEAIEETTFAQEQIGRQQQDLNQQVQDRADRENIRRSEVQRQLDSIEPEKITQMKAVDADQASLSARLQGIERDGNLPLANRMYEDAADRAMADEEVRSELEELPARRARVEEEASRRASELQGQLSGFEVEAAQASAESNRAGRQLQEESTRVANRLNAQQRELDRLRESLNTAIVEEKAAGTSSEAEQMAAQRAREMEGQLAAISDDRDRLVRQLEELAPLVDAQREATSGHGAEDLAKYYVDSADQHRTSWRRWLTLLIVALALSGGLGLLTVQAVAPGEDPELREVFHSIAVALLVIGLLLYLVRITSLQFRVHRNLEAIDRSKAAALRTYNRIVSGATPEVRGTLVATLAEAVFRTSDTGFVGDPSDHVTLVERVVGSVSQRATG
jgi:hypothetical protein